MIERSLLFKMAETGRQSTSDARARYIAKLPGRAARLDEYWLTWRTEQTPGANVNVLQTLRTQYRVSDILSWQRDGSLQLNPYFQRRSVWKKGAKSYLIDTMLRGLPVPIIFLRDLPASVKTLKSKRDVVDGQQRIRTILSFISPNLVPDFDPLRDEFVIDRNHNSDLGGSTFENLPAEQKQQLLDYQFSVHSFPSDTDDRLILQIFARMNATGYKLNPQELRNAEFFKAFKSVAYELATEQLNRWRDWAVFNSDEIARMHEVELTSEFLMLITHGTMEKSAKKIDAFYKYYDDAFEDGPEARRRFRLTFDEIEKHFDNDTMKRLFNRRSVFYGLFSTIYGLQFGLRKPIALTTKHERLKRVKAEPISNDIIAHIKGSAEKIRSKQIDAEIAKALRGATADVSQRRAVIRFLAGPGNDPCKQMS